MVLMVLGCGYFAVQLRQMIKGIYSSDLGEDNEMLTAATPGMAQWIKTVRDSGGRVRPRVQATAVGAAAPKKGSKAAARLEQSKATAALAKAAATRKAGKAAKAKVAPSMEADELESRPLRPKRGSTSKKDREMEAACGGGDGHTRGKARTKAKR